MAKTAAGITQKGFQKSFKGVPAGIGGTGKLLTRIQRVGLQQYLQSPERQTQLGILRQMAGGQNFGLSPEEEGRIQEQGRLAQEAAYRQATDQIGNLSAAGALTAGQRQQLTQNTLLGRSTGLAEFQRQEFLRKLAEARQGKLFQVQGAEALANALTGIPNFEQFNELLRTRILASQVASQNAALQGAGGSSGGGGGSPFGGILGQVAGAFAGRL